MVIGYGLWVIEAENCTGRDFDFGNWLLVVGS
jgi:hypothetical protein